MNPSSLIRRNTLVVCSRLTMGDVSDTSLGFCHPSFYFPFLFISVPPPVVEKVVQTGVCLERKILINPDKYRTKVHPSKLFLKPLDKNWV